MFYVHLNSIREGNTNENNFYITRMYTSYVLDLSTSCIFRVSLENFYFINSNDVSDPMFM